MKARILLVDDIGPLRSDMARMIQRAIPDCEIHEARNEKEAAEIMAQAVFWVVVSDIDLSAAEGAEDGGFTVLKTARDSDPETQLIAITAYADTKKVERLRQFPGCRLVDRDSRVYLDLLANEVVEAVQRSENLHRPTRLTIYVPQYPGGHIQYQLEPRHPVLRETAATLDLDFALLKEAAAGIGALTDLAAFPQQNALSKLAGQVIWNELFTKHPELLAALHRGLGTGPRPGRLLVRIVSNNDALDVPFELLHDGSDYLGLQQPLVRFLRNAQPSQATWAELHAGLEDRKPVRILLIAANTCSRQLGLPGIPLVDDEVEAVKKTLAGFGDRFHVEALGSWETHEELVRRKLEEAWHIIHYAGHGTYDASNPDDSRLHFWQRRCPQEWWPLVRERAEEAERLRGTLCSLRTADLRHYFEEKQPMLVYLSCCHSARAGHPHCLAYGKSLGLVDALVRTGVPLVVGHRWPLIDGDNSIRFVQTFYERLLRGYPPEHALLSARTSVGQYEANWASSLMVMQTA